MKKKLDKRKLIKRMDVLFSKIVRSIGSCDHCGAKTNLQCSHIISRKYLQTRWDLENAIPLCVKCHLYWQHKNPHEFVRWFDAKYGGSLYEELQLRASKIAPVDHVAKFEELKEVYEKVNS